VEFLSSFADWLPHRGLYSAQKEYEDVRGLQKSNRRRDDELLVFRLNYKSYFLLSTSTVYSLLFDLCTYTTLLLVLCLSDFKIETTCYTDDILL